MSVSPVCSCLSCPTHRGAVERPVCGVYPSSSMTDEQWKLLEPLLPPPGNTGGHGGRPEKHPRRRVLDAIFCVVRGGIAWAALPAEFPPAKTLYGLFRRWAAAGAWARIHDALRDRAGLRAGQQPAPTAAVIDSASVRGADTLRPAPAATTPANGSHAYPLPSAGGSAVLQRRQLSAVRSLTGTLGAPRRRSRDPSGAGQVPCVPSGGNRISMSPICAVDLG